MELKASVYTTVVLRKIEGELKVLAVKCVDDILFTGCKRDVEKIISGIEKSHDLGTLMYTPGTFQLYRISITQESDFHVALNCDDNLNNLSHYISLNRRKDTPCFLNGLEINSFASINSSLT